MGSTGSCTLVYFNTHGQVGQQTVQANNPLQIFNLTASRVVLSGSGTVAVDFATDEIIDPKSLVVVNNTAPATSVSVTNTVTTSVSNTVTITPNGGGITPLDGSGAALYVKYLGVGNAPATGVWQVSLLPTGGSITINGNNVVDAPTASLIYLLSYPVAKGSPYTVGNATVEDGTIS